MSAISDSFYAGATVGLVAATLFTNAVWMWSTWPSVPRMPEARIISASRPPAGSWVRINGNIIEPCNVTIDGEINGACIQVKGSTQ